MKARFIALLLASVAFSSHATINMASEITYSNVSGLTYEITLTTYVDSNDNAPNSVWLYYGTGDSALVVKSDSAGLCNDVVMSRYISQYVYPGTGTYTLSYKDSARKPFISNLPNSQTYEYGISSELIIPALGNPNNSVFFEDKPIMRSYQTELYRHNLAVVDPDGDSLSFELGTLGAGYTIPNDFTLNAVSGKIVWDVPTFIGDYEFAVLIKEWRNGVLVGSVIRDFLIINRAIPATHYFNWTNNYQYTIHPDDTLQLTFDYIDPSADSVKVSAYGEVFYLNNPATFTAGLTQTQADCSFEWIADADDVRNHPYITTFRGVSHLDTSCYEQDITLLIYVEPPVGIDEQGREGKMQVYPNPTPGIFTVAGATGPVTVLDIYGRVVLTTESRQVDMSNYPKGIYIVKSENAINKVVLR